MLKMEQSLFNYNSHSSPTLYLTKLHLCSSLEMFIERGANIYARPVLPAWYGTIKSLVEYASQTAHFRCVEILLDAGCDVTKTVRKDVENGILKYIPRKERKQLLSFLCDKNADCNLVDDNSEETSFTKHEMYSDRRRALRSIALGFKRVRSLKWLCRNLLRRDHMMFKPERAEKLPLPNMVISYVLCKGN